MNWRKQNEWLQVQSEEIKEFIKFLFKPKNKSKIKEIKENEEVKEDLKDSDDYAENEDEEVLYTKRGEIVPSQPKFGPGIVVFNSIIDKIHEKKNLITEFVKKKQSGQLSLTLLVISLIFFKHLS